MREIKFRGKRLDNGEWVYGYFLVSQKEDKKLYIVADVLHSELFVINPKTIGQFTGLKDKNGVEVFEGDVLNVKSIVDNNWLKKDFQDQTIVVVSFENGAFVDDCTKVMIYDRIRTITSFKKDVWTQYEVIGNIHENAEMLNQ